MTETNSTKTNKWWDSISRFVWPAIGMIWTIYGILQMIQSENALLGVMIVSTGIVIAIVHLMVMKCSNCGTPHSYEHMYITAVKYGLFACQRCGKWHKLPFWSRILVNVIAIGWGIIFLATVLKWFPFDLGIVLDGGLFAYAFLLLLVRFSPYERQ